MAAYIGGFSAVDGVGKVTDSIIGAFVMLSLSSGMNLMGIDISSQYIVPWCNNVIRPQKPRYNAFMHIEHVAIWSEDIEALKNFYVTYFGAKSNKKYSNREKIFSSYFLSFGSGARLEIMQMHSVSKSDNDPHKQYFGLTHLAISVGSEEKVDMITKQLIEDGHEVLEGPRRTGDGYYESVVLDPENNRIEITV